MSETTKNAFGGLKAAKDIVAHKVTVVKLNHQLSGQKREIGKVAHAHGIDCEFGKKAAAALIDLQQANQKVEQASRAMKQSAGVNNKAVATKDLTTAKAAQKVAEMHLNSAYDALGNYILTNGNTVQGMENEIATARSIQQKVHEVNQQISQLGTGLLKNRVGMAAVAGVAMLVILVAWFSLGSLFGGKQEREHFSLIDELDPQECTNVAKKCVTLADNYPGEAVQLLKDKLFLRKNGRLLDAVSKMTQADQEKFAKVWKLYDADMKAASERNNQEMYRYEERKEREKEWQHQEKMKPTIIVVPKN